MATYCTVTSGRDPEDDVYHFEGDRAEAFARDARDETMYAGGDIEGFLDRQGFVPCHVDSRDGSTVTRWRRD